MRFLVKERRCSIVAAFNIILYVLSTEYIPSCKRDDPNLNECAKINAKKAIPYIAQGDSVAKIPNMFPMYVNQINVQPSHRLSLNLTNLNIWGFPDGEVLSVHVNITKGDMDVTYFVPKLVLISNYTIKGSLQILPIEGDGPSNITFENVNLTYYLHWELKERKNIQYAILTEHHLDFSSTKGTYHFEHLFNGNKQLGDAMTKFMEENWQIVHNDLSPLVAEAIDTIITSIVYNILRKVPFDEVFLP